MTNRYVNTSPKVFPNEFEIMIKDTYPGWLSVPISDPISGIFSLEIQIIEHETENECLEFMVGLIPAKFNTSDLKNYPSNINGVGLASSKKGVTTYYVSQESISFDGKGYNVGDQVKVTGNTFTNEISFHVNGYNNGFVKFKNFRIPDPCVLVVSSGNFAKFTLFKINYPKYTNFEKIFERNGFMDTHFLFY